MAKIDITKRSAFALAYAEHGNATQAALQAGVPQASAHSMGYRWLRDERVITMIREAMDDRLKGLGPLAVKIIKDIMLSEHASPQTRLNAAKDILDRLGWVPPRRAERVPSEDAPMEEMTIRQLEELASGQPGVRLDEASLTLVAAE